MNYYNKIKDKLIQTEIYDRVKDYSKERNRVNTYYEIGKLLSEAGKEYGKNIIKQYSEKLIIEVGKKYNERTLRRIRQFYMIFKDKQIWSAATTKLTWTHYQEILGLNNKEEIKYYINKTLYIFNIFIYNKMNMYKGSVIYEKSYCRSIRRTYIRY